MSEGASTNELIRGQVSTHQQICGTVFDRSPLLRTSDVNGRMARSISSSAAVDVELLRRSIKRNPRWTSLPKQAHLRGILRRRGRTLILLHFDNLEIKRAGVVRNFGGGEDATNQERRMRHTAVALPFSLQMMRSGKERVLKPETSPPKHLRREDEGGRRPRP